MIDPMVKKRMDRERELAADLKNAEDLLGGSRAGTPVPDLSLIGASDIFRALMVSDNLSRRVLLERTQRPPHRQPQNQRRVHCLLQTSH